jgi:glucoamylase
MFGVFACVLLNANTEADDLGSVIQSQASRSFQLMLQNISRADAAPGSVVAAPSTNAPNYYFHWVRDGALVMDSIVKLYAQSSGDNKAALKDILAKYVTFSRTNQTTPNRSGGLGEPRFNANGTADNLDWARPQNDGAALRAITLIHLAKTLINEGQAAYVKQVLYDGKIPTESVIKSDLEFVAYHWGDFSYDPWEEIGGHHFYTLMVTRGALIQGAALADMLDDGGAAEFYRAQAQNVTNALKDFWNNDLGSLIETVNQTVGRSKSGLDTAVILGVLHGNADGFLNPSNDIVMATAYKLLTIFQKIYDINQNNDRLAPAIGRYAEDIYNGSGSSEGNPWFIATLGYAELCHRIRLELSQRDSISVSALNQGFFNYALQGRMAVQPGQSFQKGSQEFNLIVGAFGVLGDRFFERVLTHRGSDGSLSEQINRHAGAMQGAPNLSWSHASFISATLWRQM